MAFRIFMNNRIHENCGFRRSIPPIHSRFLGITLTYCLAWSKMAGITVYQFSFWWRFGWSIPLIHRNIVCLAKNFIAALTLNRCRRRKCYNFHICLNRCVLFVLHFGFVFIVTLIANISLPSLWIFYFYFVKNKKSFLLNWGSSNTSALC